MINKFTGNFHDVFDSKSKTLISIFILLIFPFISQAFFTIYGWNAFSRLQKFGQSVRHNIFCLLNL